jgi:cytochrome c nitrite reductase small subunit
MTKVYLILTVCIGILVGIASYTFFYAKGYSYMLDDPEVCKNCHVMNDQCYSWIKSSHRSVANCNDCHTPKDFSGKWLIKGLNGWNHSSAFTTGNFHLPIQINIRNRTITKENCRYCHSVLTTHLTFYETENTKLQCTYCHQSVGHLK